MLCINIMNIKEFLFTKKVSELKMICKESGIIGVSKLNKAGLVEIMSECELANLTDWYGLKPELEVVEEQEEQTEECICDSLGCDKCEEEQAEQTEEEIILHLPIKVANHSEKWKEMFAKGKKILSNNNADSNK